ncbi:MAG TPA: winged helix-turn-helix transcriptional regulator, partial [Nitrospirae bacterium]|nr:winged helix-turn-helix transcriptional regulator [Nitrospirota bacterium]
MLGYELCYLSTMQIVKEDNPTRKNIILLLKKAGGLNIDQLSKELGITTMGIRQHILSLEKKGLVTYETKRRGIGRPGFFYSLTDKADELFPKQYQSFLLELLSEIERREGRKKVDEIFRWRKNRLLKARRERVNNNTELSGKIRSVEEILTEEGYLVEVEEVEEAYLLKQYNCTISGISRHYRESCRHELEMYRELLGKMVSRNECMSEGAVACIYNIPKNG